MTKDYYILQILASIMSDAFYKQTYAYEVKMLLQMLNESRQDMLNAIVPSPSAIQTQ